MGVVIKKIGKQSIIEEDGKYFVHCRAVGIWAFFLSTLEEAERLAETYKTGRLEESHAHQS